MAGYKYKKNDSNNPFKNTVTILKNFDQKI